MKYCKDCVGFDECKTTGRTVEFAVDDGVCIDFDERKPQTNAERIRSMSDEELAKHLVDIGWDCHLCAEHRRLDNEPLLSGEKCDEKCAEHCLQWLQQPAEIRKEDA